MIYFLLSTVVILLISLYLTYLHFKSQLLDVPTLRAEIAALKASNAFYKDRIVDPLKYIDRTVYENHLGEKDLALSKVMSYNVELAEELTKVNEELLREKSKKKSHEVKMGRLAEQLVPFLEDFNHDPKDLRPMFNPIDYVCFEEDMITFVEVKTGQSALSSKQRNIKRLIEEGKVQFEEYRLKNDGKD